MAGPTVCEGTLRLLRAIGERHLGPASQQRANTGDGVRPQLFTEVFWAALHGLATLTRAGRLPPADAERRGLLVGWLAAV